MSAFWCGLMVVVLVPAASGQPSPDPPPPGQLGSEPTKLKPDARAGAKQVAPPPSPAPRQQPVSPASPPVETPEPQIAPTAPKRVSPVTIPPAGRPFGEKPERRAVSRPDRPRIAVALPILSTGSSTHAYVIAALSLAVVALGSGTLLTVLTRLRSTRQGLV